MTTEQGLLKAQILKSLEKNSEMNSQEIFDYIIKTPYSYHSDAIDFKDILYTGTIEALRVELVYLRKHGFIRKTKKTRMLIYALTKLGKQAVAEPFKTSEAFELRVQEEVERRMKVLQMNPPAEKKPVTDNVSLVPVQDTQHNPDVLEMYDTVNVERNCTIKVDVGDRIVNVLIRDGKPEIGGDELVNGNVININTGPENIIGLNVSDDPGKRELIEMTVENGEIKFE